MSAPWCRRAPVLAVGAAAAVAIVVAVVVLGTRGSPVPAGDVDSTPSQSNVAAAFGSTDPSASPGATAAPTPGGPVEVTWTQQPWEGNVEAVYADEATGQFIAVGAVGADLAAWTSADGETWEPHDVPEPTNEELGFVEETPGEQFGSPTTGPLTRFADTLFSIGTYYGRIDLLRPLGWRSTDGRAWEFIESDSAFYTDAYGILDVASSEAEVVVVNRGFAQPSGGTWRWTPDTSWQQTTPGGRTYMDSGIEINALTWDGARFVAVGAAFDPEQRAAAWVSADGVAWEMAPSSASLAGGVMHSVVGLPQGGLVAAGAAGDRAAAWVSADGLGWELVLLPGGAGLSADSLIATATGLVAAGGPPDSVAASATAWTSRDGRTWARDELGNVSRTGPIGPDALATMGDRVVLFRREFIPNESDNAALWVGRIEE